MSEFDVPMDPAFDPSETYALDKSGGVVRGSDGAWIPRDEANSDYRAFLAWQAAGNEPTPAPTPPVEPVVDTISWLDFMALFTQTEQAAIALSVNPSVAVFRMMATGLGGDLNLADPRVAQGIDALIGAGLLGAGRKAEILACHAPTV